MNSPHPIWEPSLEGPAVADSPRGARMPTRVIDEHEFVWMLAGQALFVSGDEELALVPGQLLLVAPGVPHGFEWDPRRASRHGFVHFRPDEASRRDAPATRRMSEHDPLAGLCAFLVWLGRERPDGWDQQIRRTLRLLFALFVSGPLPGDDVGAELPGPLSAVIGHLRREWSTMPLRRVGVEELAAAARVSRSYLNRLFKNEFGVGAAAALEGLRCSRAETLLARTDMAIGSIAREYGFADLYHFSHRFARRYGIPPSTYRASRAPRPSTLDHDGMRRLAHALWG